jgi:flagellar biosynthetic protein FliR
VQICSFSVRKANAGFFENQMDFGVENFSFVTIQIGALVFARSLGMVCFIPVLSGVEVSKFTRFIFALLLTFLVTPGLLLNESFLTNIDIINSGLIEFIICIFKEIVWGSVVGLMLKIFFEGVYLAGEAIAKTGGVSVAGTFDPMLGEEISSVSRLLFWIALTIFISTRGCELFLDGFLNVFFTVEPSSSLEIANLAENLGKALTASLNVGLKIAAPVILSTLSIYLAVGVAGRVFPQLNLMSIGFSCNSLLTLVILSLSISCCCLCFQNELTTLLEHFFIFNEQ